MTTLKFEHLASYTMLNMGCLPLSQFLLNRIQVWSITCIPSTSRVQFAHRRHIPKCILDILECYGSAAKHPATYFQRKAFGDADGGGEHIS